MKKTKRRNALKSRPQYGLFLSLPTYVEGAETSEQIVRLLCELARRIDELGERGVQPIGSVVDGVVSFETYDSKVARKFGFTKFAAPNRNEKSKRKALANLEAKILADLQPNVGKGAV